MEYILQTDNLSKVYGTKTVLDHVSIHVPKKSIYGFSMSTPIFFRAESSFDFPSNV